MPKYAIFNTINNDGSGDYTHMEDILRALKDNPLFSDVEFILIVCFIGDNSQSNYQRIHNKLKALGIPFYFGNKEDHLRFSADETLQKSLSEAIQAIIISYDSIYELYDKYIRTEVPLKFIGDHDRLGAPDFIYELLRNGRDWLATYKSRHLGLSEKHHGIKISANPFASSEEAWRIIQKLDPEFVTQLLTYTHSSDIKNFDDKQHIIPAYFNITSGFYAFLRTIAISNYFSKDIVIYHSGFKLDNVINNGSFAIAIQKIFKDSSLGHIELIRPGKATMLVCANQQHSKTLRIITGFHLQDTSYKALYRLTKFAGVSGDNTLEHSISMDVLPFYCSTNVMFKGQTLISLIEITQLPELPLSQEDRTAYRYFFNHNNYVLVKDNIDQIIKDIDQQFAKVDFPKIIESWPKVSAYLKKHKNFYNKLESIILEGLPHNAQATHYANKSTSLQDQIQHTFLGNSSKQSSSSDSDDQLNSQNNLK